MDINAIKNIDINIFIKDKNLSGVGFTSNTTPEVKELYELDFFKFLGDHQLCLYVCNE